MKDKYYIPKIEEFVEGFKYQVKHSGGIIIIDFSDMSKNIKGEAVISWFDRVVPNMDLITYPYTVKNEDGASYTFMNADPFYDPLGQIKHMLENGTIRAKYER